MAITSAQVTIGTVGDAASGTTWPFGLSGGYSKFPRIKSTLLSSTAPDIGPATTVSEPSTVVLLTGGLAGLALAVRRRRLASNAL
jgi:hypothetical protein